MPALDNPGHRVELNDGQFHTVRFTTRELIAVEREHGSVPDFARKSISAQYDTTAFALALGLHLDSPEDAADLMTGVPIESIQKAINDAMLDAMGVPHSEREEPDPTPARKGKKAPSTPGSN